MFRTGYFRCFYYEAYYFGGGPLPVGEGSAMMLMGVGR